MDRKNIYNINENAYGQERIYAGWFDVDKSTKLASKADGDGCTDFTDLYLTAGGKLVVGRSNTYGTPLYYSTISAKEAVELVVSDGTEAGDKWAESAGKDAFADAEIK